MDRVVPSCFLHALQNSVGRVWTWLYGRGATAHEICTRGKRWVVDGIANLTRDVAEVARVSWFGLRFTALANEPDEGQGTEGADYNTGEETCGERLAIEGWLNGSGCWSWAT